LILLPDTILFETLPPEFDKLMPIVLFDTLLLKIVKFSTLSIEIPAELLLEIVLFEIVYLLYVRGAIGGPMGFIEIPVVLFKITLSIIVLLRETPPDTPIPVVMFEILF